MTQEITAEQATRIHDLESYKTVTGAKRFKRTTEEMALGLTPEEALQKRLLAFSNDSDWLNRNTVALASVQKGIEQAKAGQLSSGPTAFTGEIVIRIRPGKGVDKDYFEHLPQSEIVVEQDNNFYGWVESKLAGLYEGETPEFFRDLINGGLGEIIDHPKFKPLAEPEETENVEDQDATPVS